MSGKAPSLPCYVYSQRSVTHFYICTIYKKTNRFSSLIVTLLDAELLEMIERADTDADGEISPEEFYSIMTKKTFT